MDPVNRLAPAGLLWLALSLLLAGCGNDAPEPSGDAATIAPETAEAASTTLSESAEPIL